MATLKILTVPNKVLKTVCNLVEDNIDREFIHDLIDCATANDLVGLASNQVGVMQRIFVVDMNAVDHTTEEKIEKNTPKGKMMIPKKNIYGISCANNNYTWLVEESVFEAFYTDCKTGEMLDIEKDITCCGYYF